MKKVKALLTSFMMVFVASAMFAQTPTTVTVTLTSETRLDAALAAAYVTDVTAVTSLTVSGPMKDADIITLRTLTNMTTLDMTGVTFVPETFENPAEPVNPFITSASQKAAEYTYTTGLKIVENETHYATCGIMNATQLPGHIFDGMTKLQTVTIPSSVTTFGNYCFKDCAALTTVNFPGAVTDLGSYAFLRCTGLTTFTIPSTVTRLHGTFMDCSNLESVVMPLPSGLTVINSAFARCTKFNPTNFAIPDGVTEIKEYAFYECTSLDNIVLPNNITEFDGYCFWGCENLTGTVTLSEGLAIVGYGAFYNCKNLDFKGVSGTFLPTTLHQIDDYAFNNCVKMAGEIVYPSQTSNVIDPFVFSGTGVTKVTIPEGITKIDKSAFENAKIAGELIIPSTVTQIGYGSFAHNVGITSIKVLGSATERDLVLEEWCFHDIQGEGTTVTFGEKIKNIDIKFHAFYNNRTTTTVTFPAGAIIKVGDEAFANNVKLSLVDLGAGASVTEIAHAGFAGCSSLPDAIVNNNLLKDLTIINQAVFYDCSSLHFLSIPASVTEIDKDAFGGSVSLTEIHVHRNPAPLTQTSETRSYKDPDTGETIEESVETHPFGANTIPNQCMIVFADAARNNIASYRADAEFLRLLTKTLDEDVTAVNWVNQEGADVILKRKMASKWNSVVLPFDCTQDQLVEAFGKGTLAAEFTSSNAEKEAFRFTVRSGLSNNRPVLLKPKDPKSEKTDYTIENVNIVNATVVPYDDDNYSFTGIYAKTESVVPENSYVSYQNHFVTFGNIKNHSQAFRAWLQPVVYTGAPRFAQAMAIEIADEDGETTMIGNVQDFTDKQTDHAYYTLDGRRVENPTNGIYIVNGKKVVIK